MSGLREERRGKLAIEEETAGAHREGCSCFNFCSEHAFSLGYVV